MHPDCFKKSLKYLNLTQTSFANLLDLSPDTVRIWIKKEKVPLYAVQLVAAWVTLKQNRIKDLKFFEGCNNAMEGFLKILKVEDPVSARYFPYDKTEVFGQRIPGLNNMGTDWTAILKLEAKDE